MRAGAQGIAAKILVGLIVFVLAVFGFGSIGLFSGSEPVVASVNGDDITQRALDLETSRQQSLYRAQYGDIPDEVLEATINRRIVLDQLVDQALVGQSADAMGLAADPDAVLGRIRASFAAVGGYDDVLYRQRLAELGYTPATYQASRADAEVRDQVDAGLRGTAFVTPREIRRTARVQLQKRDIAWLLFDVEALAAEVVVDDAEIEERYGTHLDDYMTEERFDFAYVVLERERFETDIEIAEEDIETAYRDEIAGLEEPRRRAAHILLETAERTAEEARAQLEAVRDEILAGNTTFEEQAEALSEDPANASDGGDLGASGRGVFPAPFEDALWALEPGELSVPVETEFGVHLIKLVGIETAEIPTLAERRTEIVEDLRADEARRRFDEALREMDTIAFEQGDSLDALVDTFGIAIETLAGVSRADREGLLAEGVVRDEWFSEEVVIEGFNSRAVAVGEDRIVVARLAARHPATERPLDEVRDEIRATLANLEAVRLADDASFAALSALADGDTPAAVSDQTGVNWETADAIDLTATDVDSEIVRTAFDMAAPASGDREAQVATLANGSRALVLLSGVSLADFSTVADADRTTLASALGQLSAQRDFAALLQSLRLDASIEAIDLGGSEPEFP